MLHDPQQAIVQETQSLMQQLEAQITNQLRQKELPPNEQYELLQQLQQLRMLQQQASQLHPPNEPPPAQSLPVGDQLASFPPAPPPQQHQQQQPVNDQQQARQNKIGRAHV